MSIYCKTSHLNRKPISVHEPSPSDITLTKEYINHYDGPFTQQRAGIVLCIQLNQTLCCCCSCCCFITNYVLNLGQNSSPTVKGDLANGAMNPGFEPRWQRKVANYVRNWVIEMSSNQIESILPYQSLLHFDP